MRKCTIQTELGHLSYYDSIHGEKVILFLHGNSSSSDSLLGLLDSDLAKNYRLIALDFFGHGSSDKAQKYSFNHIGSTLKAFCSTLKIIPYCIVGHSLGGHAAARFAHTLNCSKIVAICAPLFHLPIMESGISAYENSEFSSIYFSSKVNNELLKKSNSAFGFEGVNFPFIKAFNETDPKFRDDLVKDLTTSPAQDEVFIAKNNSVNTLLIFGEEDFLVNKEYLSKLGRITSKSFKITIVKGNHFCFTKPNETIKQILRFLD